MLFSRLTSWIEYLPGGWLIRLALLRFLAQWRALLTIIIGVLLAAMIGASVSLYTNAVAQIGLIQRLGQSPSEDVHIHTRLALDASLADRFSSLWQELDETARTTVSENFSAFPDWVSQVMAWAETTDVFVVQNDDSVEGFRARVGYYDGIENYITLLEGEFPSDTLPDSVDIQVALSPSAADRLELRVGDRFILDQQGWESSLPITAEVSGIVEALDENASVWISPAPLRIDSTRPDLTEINMLSTRASVERLTVDFMPQTRTQVGWRILFDHPALIFDQLGEARIQAEQFEDQFIAALESTFDGDAPSIVITTDLHTVLSSYSGEFDLLGAPFGVLLLQLAALVMFFLLVMGALVRRSERQEVSILQSRGAHNRQLLSIRSVEAFIICGLAVLVGVPMARIFLVVFMPLFVGIQRLNLTIHPEAYIFAGLAALFALIVLILTMLPILNRPLVGAGGAAERGPIQPWWQRYYVDVVVLVIGLVALSQLVNGGSATANTQIDPLLLLVPTLLFFALGSLSLRLFPTVMNTVSAFFARRGEIGWTMAGWQVSREPVHYGRITLLLALAISIGWFAISYQNTVTNSTLDQAAYRVGSDLRATYASVTSADIVTSVRSLEGVSDAHSVVRINDANMATSPDSLVLETGRVLAVPSDFASFTFWRSDLGELHVPRWDELLPSRGEKLPTQTESVGFWVYVESAPNTNNFRQPETTSPMPAVQIEPGILFNGTVQFDIRLRDAAGTMHYLPVTFNDEGWPLAIRQPSPETAVDGEAFQMPPPEVLPDDGWIYGEVNLAELAQDELSFEGFLISVTSQSAFSNPFESYKVFTFRDATASLSSSADDTAVLDWFTITGDWDFTSEIQARGGVQREPLSVHFDTPYLQVQWSQEQPNGRSALLYRYPEVTTVITRDGSGAETVSPSEAIGIPAVISRSFAEANGFIAGQKFSLFLDNVPLWFEVDTIVEYYPTLYSSKEQFIVVPRDLFLYTLQRRPSSRFYSNEMWINITPEANSGEVADMLTALPDMPELRSLESYQAQVDNLEADLLTSGLIGLLLLSFIVGLVLSIVSLVTYAILTVQARGGEFAVLRALGFTRWRLIMTVTVEQSFVVFVALILGVLMGLFLSIQVLPTLSISTTGALTPPFYVAFELSTLLFYCGLILIVLMLELMLTSILIGRMNITDMTRLHGE